MAYAVLQDMIDRYGEQALIDATRTLDQDRDVVDVIKVNKVLERASSLADSYLQRRYQLPITPVPLTLLDAVCSLARYMLCSGDDNPPSLQVQTGRKDALKWLSDVGTGNATLDAVVVADKSDVWSRVQARPVSIRGNGLW